MPKIAAYFKEEKINKRNNNKNSGFFVGLLNKSRDSAIDLMAKGTDLAAKGKDQATELAAKGMNQAIEIIMNQIKTLLKDQLDEETYKMLTQLLSENKELIKQIKGMIATGDLEGLKQHIIKLINYVKDQLSSGHGDGL